MSTAFIVVFIVLYILVVLLCTILGIIVGPIFFVVIISLCSFLSFLPACLSCRDFFIELHRVFNACLSPDGHQEDKESNPARRRLIVSLNSAFFRLYVSFCYSTGVFFIKIAEHIKTTIEKKFIEVLIDAAANCTSTVSARLFGKSGKSVSVFKSLRSIFSAVAFGGSFIALALLFLPVFLLTFLLILLFNLIYYLWFILWLTTLYIVKFSDYVFQTLFIPLSNCSTCKHEFMNFSLRCPNCNEVHFSLSPDFRGIFTHTCRCGASLKNELFGRNTGYIHLCPYCSRPAERRLRRAYSVQIAGPRSSGKTLLLCYLIKSFRDYFPDTDNLKMSFQDSSVSDWNNGRINLPGPTKLLNSQVSTLRCSGAMFLPSAQFDFYDASGELFETGVAEFVQRQLGYCSFLIVTIHPEVKPSVMEKAVTNVIRMYKEITGLRVDVRSGIPVAVVITGKGKENFLNPSNIKYDLIHSGFRNCISLLESEFNSIEYYLIPFINGTTTETVSLIKLRDRLLRMAGK